MFPTKYSLLIIYKAYNLCYFLTHPSVRFSNLVIGSETLRDDRGANPWRHSKVLALRSNIMHLLKTKQSKPNQNKNIPLRATLSSKLWIWAEGLHHVSPGGSSLRLPCTTPRKCYYSVSQKEKPHHCWAGGSSPASKPNTTGWAHLAKALTWLCSSLGNCEAVAMSNTTVQEPSWSLGPPVLVHPLPQPRFTLSFNKNVLSLTTCYVPNLANGGVMP